MVEKFPLKGTSGHVSELTLIVTHLPGEVVFPAGVRLDKDSPEFKWLTDASFVLPDVASEVKPTLLTAVEGAKKKTTVTIPLIALPAEAGRKELTLPRLPISISRASGTLHRICTSPHVITVEDPAASDPDPKPKAPPSGRPQREIWYALRDAVLALLIALPTAALLVWLFLRFRHLLVKKPPPPPPIPPWEVALSELREIEQRGLLESGAYEEHLDRVSDTLRKYLGKRYGFDGLESTTRELLRLMSSLAPDFPEEKTVRLILQRTDLVKFARRLPDAEECEEAFKETRRIIELTRGLSESHKNNSGKQTSASSSQGDQK